MRDVTVTHVISRRPPFRPAAVPLHAWRSFRRSSYRDDAQVCFSPSYSSIGDSYQLKYRFATRSERFMDAYRKGLNGTQAAWAGKRYRGHRVLPKNIMALFDKFGPQKDQSTL